MESSSRVHRFASDQRTVLHLITNSQYTSEGHRLQLEALHVLAPHAMTSSKAFDALFLKETSCLEARGVVGRLLHGGHIKDLKATAARGLPAFASVGSHNGSWQA